MEPRMPTRRCTRAKIPCQDIHNLFTSSNDPLISLLPENIWKSIPSTQKISCDFFESLKTFLPKKPAEELLREMKQNADFQYAQIRKLVNEEIEPNNVNERIEESCLSETQKEIKRYETPLKKMVKKDNCTRQVSDYESDHCKNQNIFVDQNVIERLEDYLSID